MSSPEQNYFLPFAMRYPVKREKAAWTVPFSNCSYLKEVNNQMGQFAFGFWSPTDVMKRAIMTKFIHFII